MTQVTAPKAAPILAADLLLNQPPSLPVAAMVETLNDVLAPAGVVFERAEGTAIVLTAQDVHLRIQASDRPLSPNRLAIAQESTYGQMLGEDWPGLCGRHGQALTVAVGSGPSPSEPEPADAVRMTLMLSVAHVAVTFLVTQLAPLAVHWVPTGRIFTGERVLAMADMLFPLPLFVHPVPFSSGRSDGETVVVGFDLLGAEMLIGVPLTMHEAPARLDWLVERALAVVDFVRETGTQLQPGDSFSCAAGERFDVVAEPETGGLALILKEREDRLMLQPLSQNQAA